MSPTCEHRFIVTYGVIDEARAGELTMWACQECAVRFYPACRVCVDIGHRRPDAHIELTFPNGHARGPHVLPRPTGPKPEPATPPPSSSR